VPLLTQYLLEVICCCWLPLLLLLLALLQNQRSTFPNVFFAAPLHDHTSCTNGVFNDSLPYCLPATEGELV
jgi:hypothetical protein